MFEHEYVPPIPVLTPEFGDAVKHCPDEAASMLSMADALQDATWLTIKNSGVPAVEIVMSEVERALGLGSEAAVTVVKMSGFTQEEDGRWYVRIAKSLDWTTLKVHERFLTDHYKSLSTIH